MGKDRSRTFTVHDYGAIADDKTDSNNNWQATACNINDPDNLGIADINYWVVEGGVGATDKFTRNGGASICARRIGAPMNGESVLSSWLRHEKG